MIDIRDYDMAMVERVKMFFENTHWINRPNIPIKEIRDRKVLNGTDVEFPIITVRRTNCPIINQEYNSWSRANTGQTFVTSDIAAKRYGDLRELDKELANNIIKSGHYDGVTVVNSTYELTYYVDVISFERDNFDTIMVEIQENLLRIPYLTFDNMKPDGTQDQLIKGQSCHLKIEEVEDTSDIENFDSGNALYRGTITIKLNAYIYRKYKAYTVEHFNIKTKESHTGIIISDDNI